MTSPHSDAVAEVADTISCTLPGWVTDMWDWQQWDGRVEGLEHVARCAIERYQSWLAEHAEAEFAAAVEALEQAVGDKYLDVRGWLDRITAARIALLAMGAGRVDVDEINRRIAECEKERPRMKELGYMFEANNDGQLEALKSLRGHIEAALGTGRDGEVSGE